MMLKSRTLNEFAVKGLESLNKQVTVSDGGLIDGSFEPSSVGCSDVWLLLSFPDLSPAVLPY